MLEIDPEARTADAFAFAGVKLSGGAKWSGGALAGNGFIYAVPALAKSVLEIDVAQRVTRTYGLLPGGRDLDDKC